MMPGPYKKVFTLLLAEIKKLGGTVIHADMQHIIIATGKTRLSSASAFIDGLRAALRRRELFSWLELEPSRQWHSLIFRGPYDYGGLLASTLPGAAAWSGHDTQGPDDFELDPETTQAAKPSDAAQALDMHWNIASFLPPSLREHFEMVVSEFIFRPWKREHGGGLEDEETESRRNTRRSTRRLEEEGDDVLDGPPSDREEEEEEEHHPAMTQNMMGREALEAAEDERAAWLGGQIEGYFSQRVLRLTGEIQKHLGPGSAKAGAQHAFPNPPGAHLPKVGDRPAAQQT